MQDLTVRQLLDLTTADVPDAANHLKKAFEWHFERSMTAVKILFGVAGSLLIGLIAAALKENIEVAWWQLVLIGASTLPMSGTGAWRFQATRGVYKRAIESEARRARQRVAERRRETAQLTEFPPEDEGRP